MRFSSMKLRQQLVLLIAIAVLLMIVVQLVYYLRFQNIVQKKANAYAVSSINQVEENLKSTITNIYNTGITISYDKVIQDFMVSTDFESRIGMNAYVTTIMKCAVSSNENIYDAAIIDSHERITTISAHFLFNNYVFLKNKLNLDKNPLSRAVFTENTDMNINGNYYYSMVMPVFANQANYEGDKRLGNLVVYCNTDGIRKVVQKSLVSENSLFAIVDRDGRVVSASRQEISGYDFDMGNESNSFTGLYKGEKSLIQYKTMSETGWKIISIIPLSELFSDLNTITHFGMLMSIVMIIFMSFVGYIFIQSITKPIAEIVRTMKIIGGQNVKKRIRVVTDNEVGIIGRDINKMLDEIEVMTKKIFLNQTELYEMELVKKHAELNVLKSQINPHFLYNTLECIRSLGLLHEIDDIVHISTAMANIFRYSIKGKDIVRVGEEMECVRDYLSIMDIRFRGKFDVVLEVGEQILDMKIIKMVLQPIIENAIYHGLEQKNGPGLLIIRGELQREIMRFDIIDNGKGMDKQELESLSLLLDSSGFEGKTDFKGKRSIGISNINRRIKIHYGSQYGIKITSKPAEGTHVAVELPVMYQ